MSASEALQAASVVVLRALDGVAIFDGPPVQAVVPYAVVESGAESGWGHKSGDGREVRLTLTVRDQGERPLRLRRLMAKAEDAIADMAVELPGWRIVTLQFLRSRLVPPREVAGVWVGIIEYRARMLAT